MRITLIQKWGVFFTALSVLVFWSQKTCLSEMTEEVVQQWVRVLGGWRDYAFDLVLDGQGNIYVTGATGDNFTTVKYNPNGNEEWVAHYDGPSNGSDKAYRIGIDALGNIYVTGMSEGDVVTIKYDLEGNQLWANRHVGGMQIDKNYGDMEVDDEGNVYITGGSSNTTSGIVTIKYDTYGVKLFEVSYSGPGSGRDHARSIEVDNNGNVIVAGGASVPSPYTEMTFTDYVTVKYNSEGIEQWVALYNAGDEDGVGQTLESATSMTVDNDGYIYVTGLTDYYQRWVTLKYSPSGTVEWVVISNNPSPRFNFFMGPPLSIKVDDTGNFYITGFGATFKYDVSGAMVWGVERTWWNTSFTDPITVDNTGNVYVGVFLSLIKYDTENGNEIWQAPFMYELDGVIANLELDNAGQIYAAGFSMCCGGFITAKYTQIKRYVESTLGGLNTEVTFGNNVELVFTDISPGTATLIESPNGPEPPSGFQIVPLEFPVYYDITFDASYTGPITVQVPYDETTLGDFQEADLRLYHYENDILVDITTLVDTDQNIVFGETMSLSPFVLLAQEPPPVVYVEIDIKPDSDVNSINHGANGVIPVAVLTTPEFDASTVDPLSISLAGAEVRVKGKSGNAGSMEDVDGDGDLDMVLQVYNEMELVEGSTEATLTGLTLDGIPIEGTDHIIIVPFEPGKTLSDDKKDFVQAVPTEFILEQNYPNPFNPETMISYGIPEESYVTITIYNVMGVQVMTLVNGQQKAGYHTVTWSGKNKQGEVVPGGLYLCRIQTGSYNKTIRMLLLK